MTDLPKVLFVEDKDQERRYWKRALEGKITPLEAANHNEAQVIFDQNPDIKVIVMDGCLAGDEVDTIPLVKSFRQSFSGPMIAASSLSLYCRTLVNAGCSHSVRWKSDVPEMVEAVLLEIAQANLVQELETPQRDGTRLQQHNAT